MEELEDKRLSPASTSTKPSMVEMSTFSPELKSLYLTKYVRLYVHVQDKNNIVKPFCDGPGKYRSLRNDDVMISMTTK